MVLKRILVTILFTMIIGLCRSQPLPATQPQLPQGDPDVVPITGIEYLILAGGAFGVYRYKRKK